MFFYVGCQSFVEHVSKTYDHMFFPIKENNQMKWFKVPEQFKCVDAHNHVWLDADSKMNKKGAEKLLEAGDRLGIQKFCVSCPVMDPVVTPEVFRNANNAVVDAMAMSDRFYGFCFVDAAFADEAVAEVKRCVLEHGMVGIKMYHQHFVDDDIQAPVFKAAAELGVPVLMHAGKCTDAETIARQPRLSNAAHFLNALKKFPDTIFMQGHIGGGGDWEWNLKVLEGIKSDNYYIDISGSIVDSYIVEKTIKAVGIDRVLFATDGSLEEGVAKAFAANLNDDDYLKLFSGNWNKILSRRRA